MGEGGFWRTRWNLGDLLGIGMIIGSLFGIGFGFGYLPFDNGDKVADFMMDARPGDHDRDGRREVAVRIQALRVPAITVTENGAETSTNEIVGQRFNGKLQWELEGPRSAEGGHTFLTRHFEKGPFGPELRFTLDEKLVQDQGEYSLAVRIWVDEQDLVYQKSVDFWI